MRKSSGIFIFLLVVCALTFSCVRRSKTIPPKELKEIYKEMFVADQWINDNEGKRLKADTTWFYLPILEKHGYTLEDYYRTVSKMLEDPKRFGDLIESLTKTLQDESVRLLAEGEKELKSAQGGNRTRPHQYWRKKMFLNSDFDVITKGYRMEKDADSVWYPRPVYEDTSFRGAEIFVKESDAVLETDSSVNEVLLPENN